MELYSPKDIERYRQSCRTEFWQEIFRAEVDYLLQQLEGTKDVLSIGCGPAIIERSLNEHGFHITGLDVSREALNRAPDGVRMVLAPAENMPLPKSSFDAVIYVASLQFIADYRKAIEEAARVLRPDGKVIVMLLNPQSTFFKDRFRDPGSYVSKIRHTDLKAMEDVIVGSFAVRTEYFLGVKDNEVFESANAADAALYVILGRGRASA
jgi:SAM-dependent methyltransferase